MYVWTCYKHGYNGHGSWYCKRGVVEGWLVRQDQLNQDGNMFFVSDFSTPHRVLANRRLDLLNSTPLTTSTKVKTNATSMHIGNPPDFYLPPPLRCYLRVPLLSFSLSLWFLILGNERQRRQASQALARSSWVCFHFFCHGNWGQTKNRNSPIKT